MKKKIKRLVPHKPLSIEISYFDKKKDKLIRFNKKIRPAEKIRCAAKKRLKELEDERKSEINRFDEVIYDKKVLYRSRYKCDYKINLIEVSFSYNEFGHKFLRIAKMYFNNYEFQYVPTKHYVEIPIMDAKKMIKAIFKKLFKK